MKLMIWLLAISVTSEIAQAQYQNYLLDIENYQQKNIQTKIQKEKVAAAEESKFSKDMLWTPTVSTSLIRNKANVNGDMVSGMDYSLTTAVLNLYKGGVDLANRDQADSTLRAQQLGLKNESLKADVAASELIFKAIYLKESLRIQEEFQRLKEYSLKVMKGFVSQKKKQPQEVVRSEIDLALQQNKVHLAQIAQEENDSLLYLNFSSELKTKDWPFSGGESFAFETSENNSIESFPTLEQKYWETKGRESGYVAAKRAHLPTVDWTLTYQDNPWLAQNLRQWTSLLELKIPLWSKYETTASVAAAYASFFESQSQLRFAREGTLLRSKMLTKKVGILKSNLMTTKANVERAQGLYHDVLKNINSGRLSTNDLVIERQRLLESESDLVSSELAYHQTVIELCALHGLTVPACVVSK
jgi:outer membrane protein TolC